MRSAQKRIAGFIKNESGVAAVELAIILPAILVLFLGIIEMSNYILVNQRAEKMAHTIADLITQEETITNSQITQYINAAEDIMQPFPFDTEGKVIISSVHRDPNDDARIFWQRESDGNLEDADSEIGETGDAANLPASFDINERETAVVAEVFYDYQPLLTNMFTSSHRIYKYSVYKPRLGTLDTVASE